MTRDPRSQVTYGELTRAAATAVWAGAEAVATTQFDTTSQARHAITAWRDLLATCQRHVWALLGTETRGVGIRASANPYPPDLGAVELVDVIAPLGARRPFDDPVASGGAGEHWANAARSLGAATDLIATHRHRDGSPAGPLAVCLEDPEVRGAGYATLAGVVIPVLGAADTLALRSAQAGVGWSQITREIKTPTTALTAATQLLRACRAGTGQSADLDELTVAHSPIRHGHPVLEVADRASRLHRVAWCLHQHPDIGVGTLADLAAVAVMLHHATATIITASAADQPTTDRALRAEAERVTGAGAVWTRALLLLRQLCTANPTSPGVHADARAIRAALARITERQSNVRANDALPQLLHLTRLQPDIATATSHALQMLASNGRLLAPGRLLRGDDITDDPDLVARKLQGRLARAPAAMIEDARRALNAASEGLTQAIGSTHLGGVEHLVVRPTDTLDRR